MRLWSLGSGSSGNAFLVESGDERLVIDAGFGTRTLTRRLEVARAAPQSVRACLLTHEHSDHVKGAGRAAVRWGWPIFATGGTAKCPELSGAATLAIEGGTTLQFDRVSVEVVRTPHDATESVGFVVTERATGARAALFYDIGHVTEAIRAACTDVDLLVLESNHDDDMLRAGPYPRWLQARIASPTGHLSNRDAGTLLMEASSPRLRQVVLAHLSRNCNAPDVALRDARASLRRARYKGALAAAPQDEVLGPFEVGSPWAGQLTLF